MNNNQQIKINFPDELKGGVYANNMMCAYTKEEFILDFVMLAPLEGSVTSRVILNPSHIKRILNMLQNNMNNYEKQFGNIDIAQEPKSPETGIGFKPL